MPSSILAALSLGTALARPAPTADRAIAARVGGSGAFRLFIREELMPAIARRVRGNGSAAIVGESLAAALRTAGPPGLHWCVAPHAEVKHSTIFRALSPSAFRRMFSPIGSPMRAKALARSKP